MSGIVKSKDNKPEPIAYSDAALRNNAAVVEYCRTSMAALSGSTAGVLGLTGLYGFAFYVFAVVILWVMFMIKSGSDWHKYYISRQSLLTNGFFGALFTYVLFWTFIYGMADSAFAVPLVWMFMSIGNHLTLPPPHILSTLHLQPISLLWMLFGSSYLMSDEPLAYLLPYSI